MWPGCLNVCGVYGQVLVITCVQKLRRTPKGYGLLLLHCVRASEETADTRLTLI